MRDIFIFLLSPTLCNHDVIPGASEQRAVAHVSAGVCGHVTPRTAFRWQDTVCDVTGSGGPAVDVASTTAVGTTTTNNDDNNVTTILAVIKWSQWKVISRLQD